MPVTITGLRLGGLDEELANSAGLFDVLNLTIDMNVGAAGGAAGQDGVQVVASPGQGVASGPSAAREVSPQVPAPPTPPVFTSSLSSPIPGPGLVRAVDDVLEPVVLDLVSPPGDLTPRSDVVVDGQVDNSGENPGIIAEAVVPYPAVTGLGVLAGLATIIEESR